MKQNFPARFKITDGKDVYFLCINHALPQGVVPDGVIIEEIPDEAGIPCRNCSSDFIGR